MRLDGRSLWLIGGAGGAVAVAVLAAVACIPDLPGDDTAGQDATSSDDSTAADVAREAATPDVARPHCGDGVIQLSEGEQCDPGVVTEAGSGGCSATCQMMCKGGLVWDRNHHCYQQVDPPAARITTAEGECGGGHVVTFASEAELDTVAGAIDAGTFWVGLLQAFNRYDSLWKLEPGWSPACPGCFAHTSHPTSPLPGADAGCVSGSSDLSRDWQQADCTGNGGVNRLHVLCELEPPGRLSSFCDAGICFDVVFTAGTKHYVLVRTATNGDTAEANCRAMGGSLVVLQSRDEREQIWWELGRLPGGVATPSAIWIGLSLPDGGSADAAADWIWDDDAGEDAYPSPWGERQPKAGTTRRAYLLNFTGPPTILDETLARDQTVTNLAYVCQLPAWP